MRHILFIVLICSFIINRTAAQPGFCGEGYSTFYSANIFLPNSFNPTLDGQILPFGSHIITVFQDNGLVECAGFVQWNGNSVSMVVNGNDGQLPGYQANEPYRYIVQLPNGCLIDSVAVTYDVAGIYTNTGAFIDGTYAKLASFHAISRPWIMLDAADGLCGQTSAMIEALVSQLGVPSTFIWSNGDTTALASNLADGQYSVTATNAFGCTTTAQTTVSNVPAMSIQLSTDYLSTIVACQSVATVSGGTAPFAYAWSNGQSGDTATNLPDGDFMVSVTDANGCTAVQMDHCTVSAVSDIPTLAQFSLAPNPSNGLVIITAAFLENVAVSISIFNAFGDMKWSDQAKGTNLSMTTDVTTYPSGIYFVVLQSGGRKAVEKLLVF